MVSLKRLKTSVPQTETNGGDTDTRSVPRKAREWTGRDLNPRPPECKSGVHAKLNYRPAWNHEDVCQTKLFLLIYWEDIEILGLKEYKGGRGEKGKGE